MKQLAFLILITIAGIYGSFFHPFWGILLYYFLAVLRPQFLWAWATGPVGARWSMIAAGAAMFGLVLNLPMVTAKLRWNNVATMVVIFGLLLMASAMGAINTTVANAYGQDYLKVLVMLLLATVIIDRLGQIKLLFVTLFAVQAYLAWDVNSLYFFQGHRLDIFHYGMGGLDNNGAGLMLAMGIPFAYHYVIHGPNKYAKAAAGLAGLMLIHAVMMSYSRGAMVSAVFGLGWLLVHHRPRWQMGGMVLVLAVVIPLLAGEEIRYRFFSVQSYETDGSAQSRLDSWSAAWQIAWDHPLTGVGIRNSNLLSHNYGADNFGRTIHSQYLQIAADTGIPAFICYLGICVTSLLGFGRARRSVLEHYRSRPASREPLEKGWDSIFLCMQASLAAFLLGAAFLSIEIVELPWLMLMLGGVVPGLVESHLSRLSQAKPEPQSEGEALPVMPMGQGVLP